MPDDHTTRIYTVTFTLVVHPESDEHLQTRQTIEEEITTWLEGLKAEVRDLMVVREGGAR